MIQKKSIAVLPLVNTSGDPGNDYFSDGLSEELIAVLAKIPDLKIIDRSSSFLFKGKSADSRTIGEKLGWRTCSKAACANKAIASASLPN